MIAFDELKAELLNDPEFAKEYEKARIEWTDLWRLRMAYGLLKGSESAFQELRAMGSPPFQYRNPRIYGPVANQDEMDQRKEWLDIIARESERRGNRI